jgi:hypothetical protein
MTKWAPTRFVPAAFAQERPDEVRKVVAAEELGDVGALREDHRSGGHYVLTEVVVPEDVPAGGRVLLEQRHRVREQGQGWASRLVCFGSLQASSNRMQLAAILPRPARSRRRDPSG